MNDFLEGFADNENSKYKMNITVYELIKIIRMAN
jgi:hypothetical protein